MKRKKLFSVVFGFFVLIGSFIMRVIDYFLFGQEIKAMGNMYEVVLMNVEGFYCVKELSLNEIYKMLLSVMLNMFGRNEFTIIILNMICQLMTIILVYIILNKWCSVYVSGFCAMLISVALIFSDKMYEASSFHLYMLGVLILLCIIVVVAKKIYLHRVICITESQGVDHSEELSSVITLDDILGKEISSTETKSLDVNDKLQEAPKGMTEIQMEEVEENKVKYIENPLPVPKRKEHKQMDYAIDTLAENDDFDLTDMTGMDFFDIE